MGLKDIAKMVNKANKQKSPAEEFLFMLNKAAVMGSQDESEYKGGVYRPSSIGSCLRRQFFMVEDYPADSENPPSAELVGILESGTDRHERIQNTVQKMKRFDIDCEWIDPEEWVKTRKPVGTVFKRREGNEARFYNYILNMHFKCDGIIKFRGQYYILEIKTEASFKHRGRVEPVPKHISQASSYSLGLGVGKVMFLYENRDVLGKKPFAVTITDEMRFKTVEEIETIETYRTLGKVPPMTDNDNDCKYCPFVGRCKRVGETEDIFDDGLQPHEEAGS